MKKTILISGASKNLGLFLGNYFKNKFIIVNLSRNINSRNKFDNYKCDLENEKSTIEILKKLKRKYNKIDLIISCAEIVRKIFLEQKKRGF